MRKPASLQESLSHWTIWRPSIAAGTTGQTSISGRVEITMPPECWEAWRGRPIASGQRRSRICQRGVGGALGPDRRNDVLLDLAAALVEADHPRHLLDLLLRQAKRLAEVAHGAARAVGGEGGDQRRVLGPVALVHARDQHLADVAGEVEVDVGHRGACRLLVEEAAGVEVVSTGSIWERPVR